MANTSAAARNRYSAKNYDRLHIMVKRGGKALIQARAGTLGLSVSRYITELIAQDIPNFELLGGNPHIAPPINGRCIDADSQARTD